MLRVDSTAPDVSIAETITGQGTLVGVGGAVELPHIRLDRSRYDYDEPWNLKAYGRAEDEAALSGLMERDTHRRSLRIEGQTKGREHFAIADTVLLNRSGRELRLQVHQLDYGRRELPAIPDGQYLSATLTPTRFAFERQGEFEDQIRGRYRPTGPIFTWASSLGEFKLERVSQPESIRLNGRPLNVDVPHIWLHGEVRTASRTNRPHQLLDHFEKEIRWLLVTLDLLDRRRTFWTDIRVNSTAEGTAAFAEDCGRWRTALSTETPEYLTQLVSPHRASADVLDRMSRALSAFPHRERLAVAISFMVSAHGSGYLEEKIMAAFASFEAAISGLPSPEDHDAGEVQELLQVLRQTLDTLPATGSVSPAAVERVRQRLAQLPEAPIARRAALLVDRYQVQWTDLWPGSSDLQAELRKALRIRNALFHTGQLTGGFGARPEAERVLVLTERLLFAALEGRSAELYERAFEHVRWILREINEGTRT